MRAVRHLCAFLVPALVLAVLPGCGESGEGTVPAEPHAAGARRSAPGLREIERALEDQRTGDASAALEALGETPGFEGQLLRARLCLLQGDAVAALAQVEEARRNAETDPRVYATAAEIYAALGRRSAAEDEIRAGLRQAGRTPELDRARGILNLTVPGAARTGLVCLEEARRQNPELPFVLHPLTQAHLIVGREELSAGALAVAATHASAALALAPGDPDALELLAETKAAANDFEGALALYAELQAQGRELGQGPALLHQRAATVALLRQDRAGAAEHYAAARRLGLDDDGLGFGANVLAQETAARLDLGIEAYGRGDLDAARTAFEDALRFSPEDLEARSHLAAVHFRQEDFRRAAEHWSAVWAGLRARELPLTEPLPLDLARAWRLAGEPELGLGTLEAFLAAEPESPWAADARGMLERLRQELAAGTVAGAEEGAAPPGR